MTRSQIRAALAEYSLKPLTRFGQNFLHDVNLCRWITQQISIALNSPQQDPILEIGPGLGSLTRHLLDSGFKLHAVEIDRGLCQYLLKSLNRYPHFQLTQCDILEFASLKKNYWPAIIGNLPYNLSTPILFAILEAYELPQFLFFMLQEELADRLRAKPGTKNYGAPSVILQEAYTITYLKTIPPQLFYPVPEVQSAILKFERKRKQARDPEFLKFQVAVRLAFQQRRKQLCSTLPCNLKVRPEELSPDEWWTLAASLPDSFIRR
jgi:16S rRNA (adenine1518-N6/adenine1519-N6)-dimethyltransferase